MFSLFARRFEPVSSHHVPQDFRNIAQYLRLTIAPLLREVLTSELIKPSEEEFLLPEVLADNLEMLAQAVDDVLGNFNLAKGRLPYSEHRQSSLMADNMFLKAFEFAVFIDNKCLILKEEKEFIDMARKSLNQLTDAIEKAQGDYFSLMDILFPKVAVDAKNL